MPSVSFELVKSKTYYLNKFKFAYLDLAVVYAFAKCLY
jgi:hypothetical protein